MCLSHVTRAAYTNKTSPYVTELDLTHLKNYANFWTWEKWLLEAKWLYLSKRDLLRPPLLISLWFLFDYISHLPCIFCEWWFVNNENLYVWVKYQTKNSKAGVIDVLISKFHVCLIQWKYFHKFFSISYLYEFMGLVIIENGNENENGNEDGNETVPP